MLLLTASTECCVLPASPASTSDNASVTEATVQLMNFRMCVVWLADVIFLAGDTPKSDRVEVSIPLIGTVAPSWTVSTNCLC
jgi:hypothetical protein